jgi:anti-sigma regulatory factor (Ser/Thr protein kinase)
MASGAQVPERVTIPALPEQVRVARAFVAGVLGRSHPCAEVALLLVRELFGNSVRHSSSGPPGETVTVTACTGTVRVEVTDRSGPGLPELRPPGDDALVRAPGLVALNATRGLAAWGR